MIENHHAAPVARTWREIPQEVSSRAMSREGRRRFRLAGAKTVAVAVLLVATAWGTYEIVDTWRTEPKKIAAAINTLPMKAPVLITDHDGVLDAAWLERTLALPTPAVLMELDIYKLQARVAQIGQVRSVVITKNFPDTLIVTITERSPVARLRAASGEDLLVARDGVVYAGEGYDPKMLRSLPWLKVARLVRTNTGYAPIPNMDLAADLLAKAKNEASQLYYTWKVVDLTRIDADDEIEVQSTDIARIVFSTQMDFFTQLARLDYARDKAGVPMKMVNVGLGSQVVMTPEHAAAMPHPPARAPKPASATPVLPAFPNVQRSPRLPP